MAHLSSTGHIPRISRGARGYPPDLDQFEADPAVAVVLLEVKLTEGWGRIILLLVWPNYIGRCHRRLSL